ncbi:MAG: BphX family protein [Cycloclasticus sp.]|nr:BphX family protein [Cycloclasticus sp.]
MKALKNWMVAVGVFYIFNLVLLWPSLWGPQMPMMYPGVNLYQGEPIFELLLDAWLIVGLGLAAIGVILLVGSRQPLRYFAALIPLVLLTEFVFGIWDAYSAMYYEEVSVAVITIIIHLIIIVTGAWVWKKACALEQEAS